MNNVITKGKKFACNECKNESDLSANPLKVGDIFECPFCGIEYEVSDIDSNGEYSLEIIEEEK